MQPRDDSNAERSGGTVARALPSQVAERLAPESRRALGHEMRRRVLRAFSKDPAPKTTRDLVAAFPEVTLQAITYHVLVLEECGSLTVSRVEQTPGSFIRSFVSNVSGNGEIVAALQETERLDGPL